MFTASGTRRKVGAIGIHQYFVVDVQGDHYGNIEQAKKKFIDSLVKEGWEHIHLNYFKVKEYYGKERDRY